MWKDHIARINLCHRRISVQIWMTGTVFSCRRGIPLLRQDSSMTIIFNFFCTFTIQNYLLFEKEEQKKNNMKKEADWINGMHDKKCFVVESNENHGTVKHAATTLINVKQAFSSLSLFTLVFVVVYSRLLVLHRSGIMRDKNKLTRFKWETSCANHHKNQVQQSQ